MIERYVKMPVDVHAVQFDGTARCGSEIARWLEEVRGVRVHVARRDANTLDVSGAVRAAEKQHGERIALPAVLIETPYGVWVAERGDWAIRDQYDLVTTAAPEVFDEDYAPYEGAPEDEACREVELPSGERLRVRAVDDPSPEAAGAIGEIVGLVRQRMAEDAAPPRGSDDAPQGRDD